MSDGRCVHDLLDGQCAVCKHVDLETGPPVTVRATFRARYEGGCSASSEHRIQPGDLAGWTDDDEIVCGSCVMEASRAKVD